MKAARRLISDIRMALQARSLGPQVDALSLATQYAARCREVNERLHLCQQYIGNGMLTEAMHAAETKPILLELAAVLDFPESAKWKELCTNNNLPCPETLDAAAMRLLNSTYGSALALEPLKKVYRRAVMARETRRCVALLREIAAREPESKNWVEDLERFEMHRLGEIQSEHLQADRENDAGTLESLSAELATHWIVDVASARAGVAASIKRVRELDATASGDRILASISASYAAFDFDALGAALRQYDLLLQEGYFHPVQQLVLQHDEAQEWWSQEQTRRETERTFNETLAQLTAELSQEIPTIAVSRLWRALTAYDRPLPEDLTARAVQAIELHRLAQVRRVRRIITLSAAAALFAVAVALFAVWHVQYTKAKQFWIAQLDTCSQALDLPRFTNTIVEIREDRPLLFGRFLHRDPDIQSVIRRDTELAGDVNRRLAILAISRRKFDALNAAGFPEDRDAEWTALLADASQVVWQEEQRNELLRWKAAREEAGTQRVAAQDSALRKVMTDIADLSMAINLTEGEIDDLLKHDKQLGGLIEEARRKAEGASQGMRDESRKQQEMALSLRRVIQERGQAFSAIRGAADINAYLAALRAYVEQFPQDKRSEAVRAVQGKAADYKFFAALPATPAAGKASFLNRLNSLAAGIAQDNYFWSPLLKRHLELEDRIKAKWPQVQRSIGLLHEDKTLAELYTFEKDTPKPTRFFVKREGPEMALAICGEMCSPTPADKRPQWKPNKTERYTDIRNVRLMEHCAAVQELIKGAGETSADDGDAFLFASMTGICADRRYPTPYLKVELVALLASQLADLVGPGTVPALDQALDVLNKTVDPEFEWICASHPDMTNKCVTARQVLATHIQNSTFRADFRFMREMNAQTLARGVKWVGFVDPNSQLVLPAGARPVEIWGLRGETSGRQNAVVLAELTPQGSYRLLSPLEPGEPLLAPGEDKSSLEVLQETMRKTGFPAAGLATFAWPTSWPANRRALTPPPTPTGAATAANRAAPAADRLAP